MDFGPFFGPISGVVGMDMSPFGLFWGFWAWIWAISGVVAMELSRFGLISGIQGMNLGHFGGCWHAFWALFGLFLGLWAWIWALFWPISRVVGMDLSYFRGCGHGFGPFWPISGIVAWIGAIYFRGSRLGLRQLRASFGSLGHGLGLFRAYF